MLYSFIEEEFCFEANKNGQGFMSEGREEKCKYL